MKIQTNNFEYWLRASCNAYRNVKVAREQKHEEYKNLPWYQRLFKDNPDPSNGLPLYWYSEAVIENVIDTIEIIKGDASAVLTMDEEELKTIKRWEN